MTDDPAEPPTSALGRRWDAALIRVATAVLRRGSPWLDGAADSLLGYVLREAIEHAERQVDAHQTRRRNPRPPAV